MSYSWYEVKEPYKEATTMNATEFARKHNITMGTEPANENPTALFSERQSGEYHYLCTLHREDTGEEMGTYFTMGPGLYPGEPDVGFVLNTLAEDAAIVENGELDSYSIDLDTDERIQFESNMEEAADELKIFLDDLYDELLWDVQGR